MRDQFYSYNNFLIKIASNEKLMRQLSSLVNALNQTCYDQTLKAIDTIPCGQYEKIFECTFSHNNFEPLNERSDSDPNSITGYVCGDVSDYHQNPLGKCTTTSTGCFASDDADLGGIFILAGLAVIGIVGAITYAKKDTIKQSCQKVASFFKNCFAGDNTKENDVNLELGYR